MGKDRTGPKASKGNSAVTKVSALHKKWMKNKEYHQAYEDLAPEFVLARAVIKARVTAALTPKPAPKISFERPAHDPDINA